MFNIFEKCKGGLLYSLSGGRLLLKNEKSIVLEITILPIISTVVSILFGSISTFLVLSAINLAILAAEALNSAIEKTCDLITTQKNDSIKYAKDAGSFSVFCIILIYAIYSIHTIIT